VEKNMARFIGVDLHRNCFTAATLAENGREYLREWKMEQLNRFVQSLRKDDRVAVEMTTNVRLFHDAVRPHVERVDVVNTRKFKVITDSVSKTDRNDALRLMRFLSKDLLPTVQLKEKHLAELASLTRTRDTFVKQRTTLKNKVNNRFAAHGQKIEREQMSSNKALDELEGAAQAFGAVEAVELGVMFQQIRALNDGIAKLEKMIKDEGAKLEGFKNLVSIKGIGPLSATVLLTVIGDVRRFADESRLASYLGIVPRVSDSNLTEHRGRITKLGSKLARTTLVQCGLIAKKYNSYLASFHERIKKRKGGGKANIALARKLLGIVYRTLMNRWEFADFANYRLKDGRVPTRRRNRNAASRRDLSRQAKPGGNG